MSTFQRFARDLLGMTLTGVVRRPPGRAALFKLLYIQVALATWTQIQDRARNAWGRYQHNVRSRVDLVLLSKMAGAHRTQECLAPRKPQNTIYSAVSSLSAPALTSNVDIVQPYTRDRRAPYHLAMTGGCCFYTAKIKQTEEVGNPSADIARKKIEDWKNEE